MRLVGGTVDRRPMRAQRALLPGEDIVYLGDTACVPYGNKSPRTVERYALACQRLLLESEVGLVLIACRAGRQVGADERGWDPGEWPG